MFNRLSHKSVICVFITLILLSAGLLSLFYYLPYYIESRIIPGLAQKAGLESYAAQVKHIGISGAQAGPIFFGLNGKNHLEIKKINIDYTLGGLFKKKIKAITISGLRVTCRIEPDCIIIAGIKASENQSSQRPSSTFPDTDTMADLMSIAPFTLERLSANDAMVDLYWKGLQLKVPIEAKLNTSGLDNGSLSVQLRMKPRDSDIGLTAKLSKKDPVLRVKLEHLNLYLEHYADLLKYFPGLSIKGIVEAAGQAAFQIQPFDVMRFAVDASLSQSYCSFQPQKSRENSLKLIEAANMTWRISAQMPSKKNLSLTVNMLKDTDQHPKQVKIQTGGTTVHCGLTELMAEAKGQFRQNKLTARYHVTADNLAMALAESKAGAARMRLNGRLTHDDQTLIDNKLELEDASGKAAALQFKAPLTTVTSTVVFAPDNTQHNLRINGQATIDEASIKDSSAKIAARGIRIKIPVTWPPEKRTSAGNLDIKDIIYNRQSMGIVKGWLRQDGKHLAFNMTHSSKLLPGLNVTIKGKAGKQQTHVDVHAPAWRPEKDINLGDLIHDADGYEINGTFETRGQIQISSAKMQGWAWMDLKDGYLLNQEQALSLTGIQTRIRLQDLIAVESDPKQDLKIEKLHLGNINADDVHVNFKVQSARDVRINAAQMQWCQGKVNIAPTRLELPLKKISTVINCKKLNLVMMLEQLGVAQGSGDAVVSGRIPVQWYDKKIRIHKGFLTSPPGLTGIIELRKLGGANQFVNSLAPDTPQRTQLDIAMESIKNYKYTKIDLRLSSQDEMLLMQLQMKGRPNQLLPFAYDQAKGQLKRIEGKAQADFKGVDIDLNFSNPFDQILRYKDLFDLENLINKNFQKED
ncbi:MAG: hypothetical protein GY874_04775 [Desulfobacteraceae bacterium]|nr:hypothetical protein [Desulfobacteraceae bacterium]